MTLLNITAQIVGFLCQDHIFSKDNFNGIKIEPQFEENRNELILASLDELVVAGMVKRLGEKDVWILITPPGSQGQDVKISLGVCSWLAETINDFSTANKLEMDVVSPLAIHEGHIVTLLEIIHDLISDDKEG